MNTEIDLMAPRIKVIAPGPLMENKVGSLLKVMFDGEDYSFGIKTISTQHFFPIDEFKQWPYMFKILEWWEEREESQMPEYLKYYEETTLEFVLKVERYKTHNDKKSFWSFEYLWENEPDIKRMALTGLVPATKEDYEDYQTFKKQNV